MRFYEVTVGLPTAVNRSQELTAQLRGALNNALTTEELVEALLCSAGYRDSPATAVGVRSLRGVSRQRGTP